jgi:hypothetical protein
MATGPFTAAAMRACATPLRSSRKEFWRNWSIVTGIPLPADGDPGYFSCAC